MRKTPLRADTPARRAALFGVLLALTVALAWVERLIPVDALVPGARLGLANLTVLCGLYLFPMPWALALTGLKILLTGLLFGNYYSLAFSVAGGCVSCRAMWLCKILGRTVGFTSVLGGVFHNLGQLLCAWVLLGNMGILAYFPVLLLAGMGAGAAVGAVGALILRRLWSGGALGPEGNR